MLCAIRKYQVQEPLKCQVRAASRRMCHDRDAASHDDVGLDSRHLPRCESQLQPRQGAARVHPYLSGHSRVRQQHPHGPAPMVEGAAAATVRHRRRGDSILRLNSTPPLPISCQPRRRAGVQSPRTMPQGSYKKKPDGIRKRKRPPRGDQQKLKKGSESGFSAVPAPTCCRRPLLHSRRVAAPREPIVVALCASQIMISSRELIGQH